MPRRERIQIIWLTGIEKREFLVLQVIPVFFYLPGYMEWIVPGTFVVRFVVKIRLAD